MIPTLCLFCAFPVDLDTWCEEPFSFVQQWERMREDGLVQEHGVSPDETHCLEGEHEGHSILFVKVVTWEDGFEPEDAAAIRIQVGPSAVLVELSSSSVELRTELLRRLHTIHPEGCWMHVGDDVIPLGDALTLIGVTQQA